jgi:hypothetical protein
MEGFNAFFDAKRESNGTGLFVEDHNSLEADTSMSWGVENEKCNLLTIRLCSFYYSRQQRVESNNITKVNVDFVT